MTRKHVTLTSQTLLVLKYKNPATRSCCGGARPPWITGHLLPWHDADVGECLKQAGCEMVRCDSHRRLHVLREAATPPPFPSLQSGGNRTECRAAQKPGRAIFTTLCSGSVRGPSPRRPVASSLPQAAEFNPRTALPRGDGKHLASCSGYKASVSQPRCCWRHSRPLSHGQNLPNGAWLYCFCKQSMNMFILDFSCYGKATMASKRLLKSPCFAKMYIMDASRLWKCFLTSFSEWMHLPLWCHKVPHNTELH